MSTMFLGIEDERNKVVKCGEQKREWHGLEEVASST